MRKLFFSLLLLLPALSLTAGVRAYRGVPYAHAERFAAPTIVEGFDASKGYHERGPICWQFVNDSSRKWGYMGHNEQSDDCQVLSIYTPVAYGEQTDELLPVFVYIHGGSYHAGGSEQVIQDLSELAEREHIVCVSISYRLGVFGFLYDPDSLSVDLGLQDQLLALHWVNRNIASFGGDPQRVTLAGQSAGAQSVAFLLGMMREPLVQQAVLFSAPLGITVNSFEARAITQMFYRELGHGDVKAGRRAFREASADSLLAAQARTEKHFPLTMPFMPVGAQQMPKDWESPVKRVIICVQEDDGNAIKPGTLGPVVTKKAFANPAYKYQRFLSEHGVSAQHQLFTWRPESSPYGATHCCELPLFEGQAADWVGSMFVGNADRETIQRYRERFMPCFGRFIKTGVWSVPQDISKKE